MKVCAWFLLFAIFAIPNSNAKNQPANSKSVTLALETVLEFNKKDQKGDIKLLDDVHEFISKVKTAIGPKNSRRHIPVPRPVTLTGFVQELIHILNSYDDKAFEEFFKYLDDEIRKYHYRGCKFYELTENLEIRKVIGAKLNMIKGKPVIIMRSYINLLADMIRDEEYDTNVKELVDYINSLYGDDTEEKFHKILKELEYYGKSKSRNNNNLVKIIRDGVRSILFDYYSNLNANARKELKNNIELFWKKQYKETRAPISSSKSHDIYYTEGTIKTTSNNLAEYRNPKVLFTTPKKVKYIDTTKGFDIKANKKTKYLREVIPDIEEDDKKGYRQTRADIINHIYHVKETTDLSLRNQKQPKEFSSEKLTDVSIQSNSIEFSQELHREYNDRPYQTLYTEDPHSKHTTTTEKVSKKHVHRSHKHTTEKTEDFDDKIKSKHHSKHKKYDKTKHGSKHDTSNDKKHDKKHNKHHKQTHNKKHHLRHDKKHDEKTKMKHKHHKHSSEWSDNGNGKVYEHYKVMATNMELYDYKKHFGPVKSDLTPKPSTLTTRTYTLSEVTTPTTSKRLPIPSRPVPLILPRINAKTMTPTQKTPSSTASTSRWLVTSEEYHEPSKHSSKTKEKRAERHLSSDEGISIEITEKDKNNRRDTGSYKEKGKSSKVKHAIKRINDIEKELKDVKNELIDIKGGLNAKKREVKDKKGYMKKVTYSEITNIAMQRKNFQILGDHINADKKFKYKYVKEKNSSNITAQVATNNKTLSNNKISKTKEDDKTIATQTNFIYKVSSGTKVTKGIKFMIEDQDYVNAKDPRLKNDYDGVDEWKALKFARIEPKTSTKATKSSTVTTVKSSTITTIKPSPVPVSSSSKSAAAQRSSETTLEAKTSKHNTTSLLSDVTKSSPSTTEIVRETRNSNVSTLNIVKIENSTNLEM